MSVRARARKFAPPILLDLFRRWSGRSLRFDGRPADWQAAQRLSSGYAAPQILERVLVATRAVASGSARFERDSMLFDEPAFSFPVLAALLRAASGDASGLQVIDIGGSLGSTYRQCRPFLPASMSVCWRVVEQAAFADAGRREFATGELQFFDALDALPPVSKASVILALSVLQYLEDPSAMLNRLAALPSGHLVIDRTPVARHSPADRLCVQHVPAHIYAASYPCWILSHRALLDRLSDRWRVVAEYPCAEGHARTEDGLAFEFIGLILESRT